MNRKAAIPGSGRAPARTIFSVAALALLLGAGPSRAEVLCGDVNDSGKLTSSDALSILRGAVGLEVDLLCEPRAKPQVTGQTDSFGSGSDGEVQAGLPLALVDNGDGTVSDLQSGLVWEKKDAGGGIHDYRNVYTWSATPGAMDGEMVTTFLAALNAGDGFAGHKDWRIPNIMELMTVVEYDAPNSSGTTIGEVFDSGCVEECTTAACSCTGAAPCWTSTTDLTPVTKGGAAWSVDFGSGKAAAGAKSDTRAVRAVRGGL